MGIDPKFLDKTERDREREKERERQSEGMVVEHIDPAQHALEQAPTTPAVWNVVSCRPEWTGSKDKCQQAALRDSTACHHGSKV